MIIGTDAVKLLADISGIGTDRVRGGYSRHVFDSAERELREWFLDRAAGLGLDCETDRNGNIWAWWGKPGKDAIVTGSHLDSVPGGGAYDGPLGVVCALDAIERLQLQGFTPTRPCAVVVFAEEEGARFGMACLGSRLLTGALSPAQALALKDPAGTSFHEAIREFGLTAEHVGQDQEALDRIGLFVELHVEQGRGLVDSGAAVGVAHSILEHGRWRLDIYGQGNHAGSTLLSDRHDPMIPAAEAVLATRRTASAYSGARATIGRLVPVPGGTNVIPSKVSAWLDVRSTTASDTRAVVEDIRHAIEAAAAAEGCRTVLIEESYSGEVVFDRELRERIVQILGGAPVLPTGAGHDAGVLASRVPTAMLFVRNPSGVSHAPEEGSTDDDVLAGVDALKKILEELL